MSKDQKELKEDIKMSLKLKILGCISVIAALGAIAILVVILMTGNNETNQPLDNDQTGDLSSSTSQNVQQNPNDLASAVKELPDYKALELICTKLDGYWTFEPNQFFGFIFENGKQFLEYGLYATSYGIRGEITNSKAAGEYEMAFTIYIPAEPATEMDDARPEKTETIYVDISHFNLDGRINVKIENLGDGEWHTYNYGGDTLEAAYNNR